MKATPPVTDNEIAAYVCQNPDMSYREIEQRLGVSRRRVSRVAVSRGLRDPLRPTRPTYGPLSDKTYEIGDLAPLRPASDAHTELIRKNNIQLRGKVVQIYPKFIRYSVQRLEDGIWKHLYHECANIKSRGGI